MNEVLYSYLLQHNNISIPGLGTIYVERVPARSDFSNKQILAPSFHFRFDRYFDAPDKDFFTYLALQKEMADYEAIRWYNEWAFELRSQIKTDQPVELPGVGFLKKDLAGEIIFEEAGSIQAYLPATPAHKVIRSDSKHIVLVGDKQLTNVEINEYLHEPVTYVEKESWWIYVLIIAAIALIVLFFHFYRNGINTNAVGNQQTISRNQ